MNWAIALRGANRWGRALGPALALACSLGCSAPRLMPLPSQTALHSFAALARSDIYGRPIRLEPLLGRRAVLYFYRSTCPHCAGGVASAQRLARRRGVAPLIVLSRESAADLRRAFGPLPQAALVVIADTTGEIVERVLGTRFVPRLVAVAKGRAVRDAVGLLPQAGFEEFVLRASGPLARGQ